jgi:putative hemolysin
LLICRRSFYLIGRFWNWGVLRLTHTREILMFFAQPGGVVTHLVDKNHVSFLFGCSSFAGMQPQAHTEAFRYLYRNNHIALDGWRPLFHGGYRLAQALGDHQDYRVTDLPPLLRAYLVLGGKVSDHAAIDPDLGTTLLFAGVDVAQVRQKRAQRLRAILAAH